MDEFIREVADFIYHMIGMRPRDVPGATVEVEAKIGILRDRLSGNRLNLPVLTETSMSTVLTFAAIRRPYMIVLSPNFGDFRFESNMTSVRPSSLTGDRCPPSHDSRRNNINISIYSLMALRHRHHQLS